MPKTHLCGTTSVGENGPYQSPKLTVIQSLERV